MVQSKYEINSEGICFVNDGVKVIDPMFFDDEIL